MNIFGIEIRRAKDTPEPLTVVSPNNDDGSTIVTSAAAGYYAQSIELEGRIKNETDLIRRYREISQYPDCESAIEDICNEAIVIEENEKPIVLNLDDLKISQSIKNKISDEFDQILNLLDFNTEGHDLFRSWYIDGRIYFNVIVDENNPKEGIHELRQIDPRKIRKIKSVKKKRTDQGIDIVTGIDEYFLFNDKGISESNVQGVRLPIDSVLYAPSGLVDANTGMVMGYLHKAIKVVNQLKMMEDAAVIYRITRSPERRIFYVDVGNLPKLKAEQYVNDIMNKFRNKITYDSTTGEIADNRRHMSMMEDFYLPRRDSGRGTEITTLPGLQNPNAIEDLQYFQNKLFQCLNVPMTRLKGENGFSLGRASEITRDELKFNKFITRIRNKFARIFLDALRIQLILKGIINPEDWEDIRQNIRFDFVRDNYYAELKESEILQGRLNLLQIIDPYVGKYYSVEWVKRNVLQFDDSDIQQIEKQIVDERQFDLDLAHHQGEVQVAQQQPMNEYQQELASQQQAQQENDMQSLPDGSQEQPSSNQNISRR